MNRIIISSIAALLVIAAAAIGYIYYQQYNIQNEKPENAIPADAAFFLKGNLKHAVGDIQAAGFWKTAQQYKALQKMKGNFIFFDSLLSANVRQQSSDILSANSVISFHATGVQRFDLLFIIPVKKREAFTPVREAFTKETPFAAVTTRQFDGVDIFEIPASNGNFTCAYSRGLILGSFASFLVEDAIRQQRLGKPFGNENFRKFYESASATAGYLLCVNQKEFFDFLPVFIPAADNLEIKKTKNENWLFQKMNFSSSSCSGSGEIIRAKNSADDFRFAGEPGKLQSLDLLPENTALFSASISDSLQMFVVSGKNKGAKTKNGDVEKYAAMFDNEINSVTLESNSAGAEANKIVFIKAKGKNVAADLKAAGFFKPKEGATLQQVEKYQGYEIRTIPYDGLLAALFGEAYKEFQKTFFITYKNFLIASGKPSVLRRYITDFKNEKLLVNTKDFTDAKSFFKGGGNYFYYFNPKKCLPSVKAQNENDETAAGVGNDRFLNFIKTFSMVVSNAGQKQESNFIISFNTGREDDTPLLLACESDTSIIAGPVYFADANDNQGIFLQDSSLNLILYDNRGNIKWKQSISEKIVGDISCIGFLDNASPQFLFATASYIYFLDQNGNNLGNFPMKLPAAAVSGICLDTAQNRNDFFICCANKRVYGYEISGRPAKGWEYISSGSSTSSEIKVAEADNKQFIYWLDDYNNMHVHEGSGALALNAPLRQPVVNNNLFLTLKSDSVITFSGCDSMGSVFSYHIDGSLSVKSTDYYGMVKNFLIADLEDDGETEIIFVYSNAIYIYNNQYELKSKFNSDDLITSTSISKDFSSRSVIAYSTARNPSLLSAINSKAKQVKGFPVQGQELVKKVSALSRMVTLEDKKLIRVFGRD